MADARGDHVDRLSSLERELQLQRRLVSASHVLHSTLDQDELLGILLSTAAEGVDAERGTVYLASDDHKEVWSRVVSGGERLEIRLPLGKGIAGAVAQAGTTIRIDDAYADPRFDRSVDRRTGFRTRSILCAPIKNRQGVVVGVFQLLNKRGGPFGPADDEYLSALSVHAALAIENARLHRTELEKERQEREIRVAQGIQRAIQPEARSHAAGPFALAGLNELCEDASGDYYDFIEAGGGRVVVAVGDVSGHGLGSALVMAEARAFLRAVTRTVPDVAQVMALLNEFLVQDLTNGKFMSFFAGVLDPATRRFSWCSAGHNPPFHWRAATRTFASLDSTGPVLGILAGVPFERGPEVVLEPGDLLLLYTDGATEAPSSRGDQFGEERLQDVLRAVPAAAPPADVLGAVQRALKEWTGGAPNRDDLTLVCVRAS